MGNSGECLSQQKICSLRDKTLEKLEKAAQETGRRLSKHFQEAADGRGTSVAPKPTLFSSKGWFENFKMCFSWQKVQLIGISGPAVYLMADRPPPTLNKLTEARRDESQAVAAARPVGGDRFTGETESHVEQAGRE